MSWPPFPVSPPLTVSPPLLVLPPLLQVRPLLLLQLLLLLMPLFLLLLPPVGMIQGLGLLLHLLLTRGHPGGPHLQRGLGLQARASHSVQGPRSPIPHLFRNQLMTFPWAADIAATFNFPIVLANLVDYRLWPHPSLQEMVRLLSRDAIAGSILFWR